jgi:hypothetical protein
MPFLVIFAIALGIAAGAFAQTPAPIPAPEPQAGAISGGPAKATRTGKERLGNKWADEQRIDNCNVPLDKRGQKPRPDCGEPAK